MLNPRTMAEHADAWYPLQIPTQSNLTPFALSILNSGLIIYFSPKNPEYRNSQLS